MTECCTDILHLQIHINTVLSPNNIFQEHHKALPISRQLSRTQVTIVSNNQAGHI